MRLELLHALKVRLRLLGEFTAFPPDTTAGGEKARIARSLPEASYIFW